MNNELFEELVSSIQEAGAIKRGELEPSRSFHVDSIDVKKIRESYDLSQNQFAHLLGISVKTLHNWEQGRREPVGAARVLLQVAALHPAELLDTVQHMELIKD